MTLTSAATLRALMTQKDISLGELADSAKVSKGFISHLTAQRRKTCTPAVAERIARRLDVPLEILFVPSMSASTQRTNKQRRATAA